MVDINPFFLTGDFDGDHRTDIAVWIKNKRTGEWGLAIVHFKDKRLFLIGAGIETERGKDLRGFDSWTLVPKEQLHSPYEDKPMMLKGDGIELTKSEAASVVLYWNGKSYGWYQTSD